MAAQSSDYVSRRVLIAAIGFEYAGKLTNARGGCRFRVPRRSDEAAFIDLARIIGYEAARLMAGHWAGRVIMLPSSVDRGRLKTLRRVMKRMAKGESPQDIAVALRLNLRHVYRLVKEVRSQTDPEQLPLRIDSASES